MANLRDIEEANAVIDLPGYDAAQAVVVKIKGENNFLPVMQKKSTGWRLQLKSNRAELKYCFYIGANASSIRRNW